VRVQSVNIAVTTVNVTLPVNYVYTNSLVDYLAGVSVGGSVMHKNLNVMYYVWTDSRWGHLWGVLNA
jgi:hypothetical protein